MGAFLIREANRATDNLNPSIIYTDFLLKEKL